MDTSRNEQRHTDIAIIGGGIGGASVGYFLGQAGATVTVLEAEGQCGYHTTGRSAAFYAESYGGPFIAPLTSASKDFLLTPPDGFADTALVGPRGAVYLFQAGERRRAERNAAALQAVVPSIHMADMDDLDLDYIAPDRFAGAMVDPDCLDLDVAAIHQGFLAGIKRAGGAVLCNAHVDYLARDGGRWHISLKDGQSIVADMVVNAAGAWSTNLAKMADARPIRIVPKRRTIAVLEADRTLPSNAPLVLDLDETFYFRPEGDGILLSPADATPMPACDVQPEELDVAVAVDRWERASNLKCRKMRRRWAGLRSFAADSLPVIGFDEQAPGFFWSAGQGGWGIQTAPAWGRLAADLILGETPALDSAAYSPAGRG